MTDPRPLWPQDGQYHQSPVTIAAAQRVNFRLANGDLLSVMLDQRGTSLMVWGTRPLVIASSRLSVSIVTANSIHPEDSANATNQ